jgi:trehalose-phosphatase
VIEPAELASIVSALPAPRLLTLDVDGTLSPIVDRPEQARLLAGIDAALARLLRIDTDAITVVALSGRPLRDLRDVFQFPPDLRLVGSHGAEDSAAPPATLTSSERATWHQLQELAQRRANDAPGAWVEDKPVSVVLHVREAEPSAAEVALRELAADVAGRRDVYPVLGKRVIELAVRPDSKASAFVRLRGEVHAASAVHIGDDDADEAVFASMGPGDVGVHVGAGATDAPYRLGGPGDVLAFLDTLGRAMARRPTSR